MPTRLDTLSSEQDTTTYFGQRPERARLEITKKSVLIDLRLNNEGLKPNLQAELLVFPTSPGLFKVGIGVNQSLLVRTARARKQLTEVSLLRLNFQRAEQTRIIQAEVRNALSALRLSQERHQAAEEELKMASMLLKAELTRFEAGESTLLFVNLRERAFIEARIKVVNTRADFYRATVLYKWATGSI